MIIIVFVTSNKNDDPTIYSPPLDSPLRYHW
jgi:hypothetical protein